MSIQDNSCRQHTPCILCARNDREYTTGECPDSTRQAVQSVLMEQDRQIQELRLENEAKAALLREYQPKARYYDAVLQEPALLPISMIAKEFGFSAQALNLYLYVRGVQYPCGGTWALCEPYAGKGYVYPETICAARCKQHTRWTQKGRAFLHALLRADGFLPLSERPYVPMDMGSFCCNRCRPFPGSPASSL